MHLLKYFLWSMSFMGFTALTALLQADQNTPGSQSAEVPLIPRKLLFGNPEKTSPKLSPDGTKLAYLAPDAQNVLNVWLRDLKNPGADRQITSDPKRGVRSFRWQFDHDHILYVQDKDGDENWHLHQTHIGTRETKDLTPFDGAKVEILSYDHKFPNEILLLINKRNPELFDVYRLNLQTGKIELDTENPGGIFDWDVDHNNNIRIAGSYAPDGSTIFRVKDEGASSPWRDWLTIDPNDSATIVDFAPDNQSVYLVSNVNQNTTRLVKSSLTTPPEQTLIFEDPTFDISSAMFHPTTHVLEAVGIDRERFDWIALNDDVKADFDYLRAQNKGAFTVTDTDLSNQKWIVVFQSDQHPASYYLYQRKPKSLDFLFSTQPELDKYSLSPMQPVTYQARDGMKLYGYLTLPLGKNPKNLPTVLFVHGGPWTRDSWGLSPVAQWLANRGYAVFQINYRGSTGYGKSYLNAGNREWAGKMHTDLLDGKEWLVRQGYADPEKVAIYGGSYGGYATLVGLTFTPDEFCCGVDVVGPSNIITLLKTFPPYWMPLKAKSDLRIGKLETEEEFLKSRSPLFKADAIKKPLLIAQGANDPRVKQAESDQIVAAMREKKLPVDYLLFLDEGHGFSRPENRLKFNAATEAFFAKYLGGRHEAPLPEENWESLMR